MQIFVDETTWPWACDHEDTSVSRLSHPLIWGHRSSVIRTFQGYCSLAWISMQKCRLNHPNLQEIVPHGPHRAPSFHRCWSSLVVRLAERLSPRIRMVPISFLGIQHTHTTKIVLLFLTYQEGTALKSPFQTYNLATGWSTADTSHSHYYSCWDVTCEMIQ